MKLTFRRILVAFVPLVTLIGMIVLGVTVFGRDAGDGPSQISLVFATAIAAVLAMAVERVPWSALEQGITSSISKAGVSIMILFLIGMLSGAWMIGGVNAFRRMDDRRRRADADMLRREDHES